jgi:hypothetical protein
MSSAVVSSLSNGSYSINCSSQLPTPGLFILILGFSPPPYPQTSRPYFMLIIKKPILSTLNLRSSIIKQHCQKGQKNEFYFEKIE